MISMPLPCRRLTPLRVLMLMLLSLVLSACGGGGGGGSVIVPVGKSLFTTAGSSVTLGLEATGVYAIGGGGGGTTFASYSAASSNAGVVKATVNGATLTLAPQGAGTATITVSESGGSSLTISVTVSAAKLFISAPNPLTTAVGFASQYPVGGGKGPYTVASSNPGVASVTLNGSAILIRGIAVGNATVVLYDAAGATEQVVVAVPLSGSSVPLFVSAPSAVSLDTGAKPVYTVAGGTSPYIVTSSAPSIVGVSINGNQLSLNAQSSGKADIAIVDSVGARVQVAATVGTSAASALALRSASTLTYALGESGDYVISGGTAPYTASSSNAGAVNASVVSGSGGSVLRMKGVSRGSAQVVVFDSTGSSVQVGVTVGTGAASSALFIAAPNPLTLSVSGGATDYDVGGGGGTLTVVSSNLAAATAGFLNGKLRITPVASGTATIAVYDSLGANASIAVNVSNSSSSNFYTTAPSAISLGAGAKASYFIGGGLAPYTATTSNSAVATAAIGGNLLTIEGAAAGSANVSVFDANGASSTLSITVQGGGGNVALHTTAPNPLSVASGATVSYLVRGGIGPYLASASNSSVLTASVTGANLNLSGLAGGSSRVVVFDSTGANVAVEVTVSSTPVASRPLFTTAPSVLALSTGSTPSYAISGGAGKYEASSSNPTVLSARIDTSAAPKLVLTALAAGSAEVSVFDEAGTAVKTTVTVTLATVPREALFTTAPSTLSLAVGNTSSYTVHGGSGSYDVSSSNQGVLSVSLTGTSLKLTGLAAGTAQALIFDGSGASVQLAVTVSAGAASTPLYTTAPSSVTIAPGNTPLYVVSGGSAPYSVSSSNNAVLTPSISGTALSLQANTAGTAQVAVFDKTGASVTFAVSVSSVASTAPLYTTAPSALTMKASSTAVFDIRGGSGGYVATSNNVGVATVAVDSSGHLTVNALANGSAQVAVFDSAGTSVQLAVTVSGGGASLSTTAPSTITLGVGTSTSYTIIGGTAPYTATSGNTAIATASVSGTVLNINAVAIGTAQIAIVDASGTAVQIATTVGTGGALYSTAPTSVTMRSGATATYTIGGGVAPYAAVSSNTAVATVSRSGTSFTVTAVAIGTADVILTDAVGTRLTVGHTVTAAVATSALSTTVPIPLSMATCAANAYVISGGTSPYTVTSLTPNVATVFVSGSALTVTAVGSGNGVITVSDSANVTQQYNLSVTAPASLCTAAPANLSMATGSTQVFVIGGAGGVLSASSSAPTIATASVSGNYLSITSLNLTGSSVISLTDTVNTRTVALTVTGGSSLFTTAPAAPSLGLATVTSYQVGGGTGPYSVTTSNAAVASAAISGNILTVTSGIAGTATLAIFDSVGALVSLSVTVQ